MALLGCKPIARVQVVLDDEQAEHRAEADAADWSDDEDDEEVGSFPGNMRGSPTGCLSSNLHR